MRSRLVASLLAGMITTTLLYSAESPDSWPGYNKGGTQRNSSSHSIAGNLQVRWARALTDFPADTGSYPITVMGQRSFSFAVREGKILLITPKDNVYPRAQFGIYGLHDGQLLSSVLSPHSGGGGKQSYNDTHSGEIIHYWHPDGSVWTMEGGDFGTGCHFNPYTGQILPGQTYGGNNCSSYFTVPESTPGEIYPMLTGAVDWPVTRSSIRFVDTDGNTVPATAISSSLAGYNPVLMDGHRIYVLDYGNDPAPPFSGSGDGTAINAYEYTPSPLAWSNIWSSVSTSVQYLCYAGTYDWYVGRDGAPRAMCLGEDGRLYYFGCTMDYASYMLKGIRTSDGSNDLSVSISPSPANEISNGWSYMVPQIATRTNYVVVFQPQTYGNVGHVFCINTATKALAWSAYNYTSGYFHAMANKQYWYPPGFQAVYVSDAQPAQMTIAGDAAYVVEPCLISGNITLQIDRFALADGTRTNFTLTPRDAGNNPFTSTNAASVVMREVAAVDGTLTCLVDYDYTNQLLVVVDGNASPALSLKPSAVISCPVPGRSMNSAGNLKTGDIFSDQPLPYNRFDSGAPVLFDSTGSIAMDGGPLTYLWDFGDSTTSTSAAPTHIYAGTGSAAAVSNYTVSLTVTDTNGISGTPATITFGIRNVGSVIATQFTAVADSFAFDASAHGTETNITIRTQPAKTGYIRFNTTGVTLTNAISARLRLYCPSGVSVSGKTNELRAWGCATNWIETTLVSNNAPARTQSTGLCNLDYANNKGPACYLDVPVLSHVKTWTNGSQIAFALDLISDPAFQGNTLNISSREGIEPPQLILQFGSAGYAAPVITNQPQDSLGALSGTPLTIGATSATVAATNLIYCWRMVNGPSTTSAIRFAPNSTTNANSTVAYISANTPGTNYTCICEVWDGLQSTTSRVVTITPTQFPVPRFTVSPDTVLAPGDITFNASASFDPDGSVAAYDWDFGDGSTGTGAIPTHTYSPSTGGMMTVTLTVTDNAGATASTSRTVNVFLVGGGTNHITMQEGVLGYTGCRDTLLSSSQTSVNNGGSAGPLTFSISGRFAIQFDLPRTIPTNATVTGAQVCLNVSTVTVSKANTTNMSYRITTPWIEGTSKSPADGATWNEAQPGIPWNTAGGDYATPGAAAVFAAMTNSWVWLNFPVTSIADKWINGTATNNGILIAPTSTFGCSILTSEYADPSLRPILSVDFTIPATANFPPTAVAGADVVTGISPKGAGGATVTLDGSHSIDLDGHIAACQWREGATLLSTNTSPAVFFSASGLTNTHTVTLTVTDDAGATNTDTVLITITNSPPVAGNSTNQVIVLPGVLGLSATVSDPDGFPSCQWSQLSGPPAAILSPSNAAAIVTGLVAGTYVFSATFTDEAGVSDSTICTAYVGNAGSYTLRSCGANDVGQLGIGSTVTPQLTPVDATGVFLMGAEAGANHGLMIGPDGLAYAFGQGGNGQLGTGDNIFRTSPTQVSNISNVASIGAGSVGSVASLSNGTVWAWGYNQNAELGNGAKDTGYHNLPEQVPGLTNVTVISRGWYHVLALMSNQTVQAWGQNTYNQSSGSTNAYQMTPATVSGLTNVIAVAGGGYHSLALKSDGTVWGWGRNHLGQLGQNSNSFPVLTSPTQIPGLTNVTAISTGFYHSMALLSNGTVWTWGDSSEGQLGDGTNVSRSTPAQLASLSNVTIIACGLYHSLALPSNGKPYAWGRNASGQLGNSTTNTKYAPNLVSNMTGRTVCGLAAGSSVSHFLLNPSLSAGSLRFATAAYSASEGAGFATITVARVGGSTGTVSITYSATNGTATSGSDFTSTNGTLTWTAGDISPKTFTVKITDDGTAETNETINLTLSAPTGGASLGTPSTAVLTITDNELAPVITSSTTATGQVGVAFSYSITASGNPTSYNATNLPSGLSVNTGSGTITGMPAVAATTTVFISASNAGGTGTTNLTLTILPAPLPPVLVTAMTFDGGGLQIQWQSTTNAQQILEWRSNLLEGSWIPLYTSTPPAGLSITNYYDITPRPNAFYRIGITAQ